MRRNMTIVEDEEHAERVRRVRDEISRRAVDIRAELAAAVARVDEHDEQLGAHAALLRVHDEEIDALKAQVGAMADIHVRAHEQEGLPLPPALRPEGDAAPLRLVSDGG